MVDNFCIAQRLRLFISSAELLLYEFYIVDLRVKNKGVKTDKDILMFPYFVKIFVNPYVEY